MPLLLDPLVLETKLTVPRCTGTTVLRSRLVKQFANPSPLPLNIICVPAGFGKSTLAAQWIDKVDLSIAWYSIDSDDNDPLVWVRYFIAAIRTVVSDFATSVLQQINASPDIKVDSLVPQLLNQIAGFSQTIVLVLDDYQLIDNEEIHGVLQQIFSHQPQQLCLIIASRTELPLALAKLRVRHQIHEVNGDDLKVEGVGPTQLIDNRRQLDQIMIK